MPTSQQVQLPSLQKECLSEAIGTYLLVFFGPASVIIASSSGLTAFQAQEAIAAVFGSTVVTTARFGGRAPEQETRSRLSSQHYQE